MKKIIFSWLLSLIFLSATLAQRGDERTGFDGDFFSLEGAIELFKNSRTISDFERRLNEEDTYVNNLDLDRDGQIDFIRVEHIREGSFHAIVLQVPLNRYDVQDIAVIEIEKTGRRRAMLQIIGDEDIYGDEVIVEPYNRSGYSRGRGGPNAGYDFKRGYVNVFWWSPVQHIFGRNYRIYRSPYYWSYYPNYWRPWRPCGWNIFRPRVVIFHRHYHHVHFFRLRHVHNFYRPYRHYSHHVVHRSNQLRVKRGRPIIKREKINHGINRKEFRPGLKKVNIARDNSVALRNKQEKGSRISKVPKTTNRQTGEVRTNSKKSRIDSNGNYQKEAETNRLGRSDRFNSGTTKSNRSPNVNPRGRIQKNTSRGLSRSNSKSSSQNGSKKSRSGENRSFKSDRKSSSSRTLNSSRSSRPKISKSSSIKSKSSSDANRSRGNPSSKYSKPSRSSRTRNSRSRLKKGRG